MSGGGPTRLPPGWEHKTVRDGRNAGRPYYQNNNDSTTHWDPPDPPDAAGSSHSSHPEASTALVPTHLRHHTPDGSMMGITSAGLFFVQTVAATILQMATPTPGIVPEWHDDRTSSELELPRRVRRRLEGPETVVSTGEPSIPVSNDQFKQCMDTHVHEDAGKIPPGDDFMQAWWKAQRQYFENSTHAQKKGHVSSNCLEFHTVIATLLVKLQKNTNC